MKTQLSNKHQDGSTCTDRNAGSPCRDEDNPSHTPTLWGWRQNADGTYALEKDDGHSLYIGTIADNIKNEEDAAYIVKCVNAHEGLVDGLKDAVEDLTSIYEWAKQQDKAFVVSLGMWRRLTAMKEALAQAEGK